MIGGGQWSGQGCPELGCQFAYAGNPGLAFLFNLKPLAHSRCYGLLQAFPCEFRKFVG